MKLFSIQNVVPDPLLLEANVINVKEDYQDQNIEKYLNGYVDNMHTDQGKAMFKKKLMKILVNDARWHHAVRELPMGAPEWAAEAHRNNDLVAFQPDQNLNDTIQHITHYIAAMEMDAQGDNPDQKAVAKRELQGFPKIGGLDAMSQKSNQYFDKGAQAEERQVDEGMKEIFNAGKGFIWYELTTEAAYKREGRTLRNCIGSMYTLGRARKEGYRIIVMKDKSNNTVVAAREKKGTLEEMKGKNNKPPVPEYMPAVARMINKFNLKLNSGAHRDVINAGYYYSKGKLYTKAEAIKQLVKTKKLGEIGFGLTLDEVIVDNPELFRELYQEALQGAVGYYYGGIDDSISLYEARDGNEMPFVTGVVADNELKSLSRPLRGDTEAPVAEGLILEEAAHDNAKQAVRTFVQELYRRKIVKAMAPKIQKELFWNEGVIFDPATGEMKRREPDEHHKGGKNHHQFEVYTDKNSIDTIFDSVKKGEDEMYGTKRGMELGNRDDYEKVYVAVADRATGEEGKTKDTNLVVMVKKDGSVIPLTVRGNDVLHRSAGYKTTGGTWHEVGERDDKTVNTLLGLANDHNFKLPKSFLTSHGVVKGKDDKMERFQPKVQKMPGDPESLRVDFSHLDEDDKFAAMYGTLSEKKFGGERQKDAFGIVDGTTEKIGSDRGSYYSSGHTSDTHDWNGESLGTFYREMFAGHTPDEVWRVNVGFGVDKNHGVLLIGDQDTKTIVRVDTHTESHKWQNWDDYTRVSDQLNKWAAQHNYKFAPNAFTKEGTTKQEGYRKRKHRGEFRVKKDGSLETAAQAKAADIASKRARGTWGKEGTDELHFKDGWKLQRMDADEQANWMRAGVQEGVRGEAWRLVDENDQPHAVVTTQAGKIMNVFTHTAYTRHYSNRDPDEPGTPEHIRTDIEKAKRDASRPPTNRGITWAVLPHMKQAMEQFGWKLPGRKLKIPQGSKHANILTRLNRDDANSKRELQSWAGDGTGGSIWKGTADPTRELIDLGLIRENRRSRYSSRRTYEITPKGKDAVRQLRRGEDADLLKDVKATEPHETWKKPEPKKKEKKQRTTGARRTGGTGATRAGSKAAQALNDFQSFVEDNDRIPTRSEFMQTLMGPPYNMSRSGAQTYYYTTKAKHARQGNVNESLLKKSGLVTPEKTFSLFRNLLVG